MSASESLLQRRLAQLEAGAPLEQCLQGLSDNEAEMLRLVDQLRTLQYPVRDGNAVAAQRRELLNLALAQKPSMESRNRQYKEKERISKQPNVTRTTPQKANKQFSLFRSLQVRPLLTISGVLFFILIFGLMTIIGVGQDNHLDTTTTSEPAVSIANDGIANDSIVSDNIVDEFMDVNVMLQEIDSSVCQQADETQAEIEALSNQGADLGDLSTAILELKDELDYCP
ncbi:MAG TPA: hypothetical protein VLE70_08360 [Anaerolineae bacterium]|nr:hypothetical protein [Anaerolineae bacterium]